MKRTIKSLSAFLIICTLIFGMLSTVSANTAVARIDLSATETLYKYDATASAFPNGTVVVKDGDGNVLTENLTYSSDCTAVASVSSSGVITFANEGIAVITASYKNPDGSTVSASIAVTATKSTDGYSSNYQSGTYLALNNDRMGNHSADATLYYELNKKDLTATAVNSYAGAYNPFIWSYEVWFYDDGVKTASAQAGASVNMHAWTAYGNVSVGILDKSSDYYSYKNLGFNSNNSPSPATRNEITYLNGQFSKPDADESYVAYGVREKLVKRNAGWHQILVYGNKDNTTDKKTYIFRVYLDGVEIFTDNYIQNISNITFTTAENAYYDDSRLWGFTSTNHVSKNSVTNVKVIGDAEVGETLSAVSDLSNAVIFNAGVNPVSELQTSTKLFYTADGSTVSKSTSYPVYPWSDGAEYKWYSSPNGSTWTEIGTGADYTLKSADNNKYIKVTATIDGANADSDIMILGEIKDTCKIALDVTKNSDGDSVAANKDLSAVKMGDDVEFTVTPAAGSIISSITAGENAIIIPDENYKPFKFTVSDVSSDMQVTVIFAKRPVSAPTFTTVSFNEGEYKGYNSGIIYQTVNKGYGWTITSVGSLLSNGEAELKLPVEATEFEKISIGDGFTFGIRAYGSALDDVGSYVFTPYIEVETDEGTELIKNTENAKTLTITE